MKARSPAMHVRLVRLVLVVCVALIAWLEPSRTLTGRHVCHVPKGHTAQAKPASNVMIPGCTHPTASRVLLVQMATCQTPAVQHASRVHHRRLVRMVFAHRVHSGASQESMPPPGRPLPIAACHAPTRASSTSLEDGCRLLEPHARRVLWVGRRTLRTQYVMCVYQASSRLSALTVNTAQLERNQTRSPSISERPTALHV